MRSVLEITTGHRSFRCLGALCTLLTLGFVFLVSRHGLDFSSSYTSPTVAIYRHTYHQSPAFKSILFPGSHRRFSP
ncbi:hypothetical protein L1887_33661 [Cichorium endivia]|nr:hypothetical protein L1887_33661 [Cichorium endivia]